MGKKTLVIGDCHFPFHHKPALTWVLDLIKKLSPDRIIQVGDIYDMFSHTRFARSHDIMTPKQEVTEARVTAEEMWSIIQRYAPKAELYQILGNHDDRPKKRILDKYPELASIVDISHLWEFDGVKTIHDSREELILDGVIFMHGYRTKLGDHTKYNHMSTVHGHTHRGGTIFIPIKGMTLWELDAGYCGDPEAAALSYGPQKINNWTLGCGWLDDEGPRFMVYPGRNRDEEEGG